MNNRFLEHPNLERSNADRARQAAQQSVAALQLIRDSGIRLSPLEAAVLDLRLKHPTATLSELAAMYKPPISKDAFAGRLHRLVATHTPRGMADRSEDLAAAA